MPPVDAGPRAGWGREAKAAKAEPGIVDRHLLEAVARLEEVMAVETAVLLVAVPANRPAGRKR